MNIYVYGGAAAVNTRYSMLCKQTSKSYRVYILRIYMYKYKGIIIHTTDICMYVYTLHTYIHTYLYLYHYTNICTAIYDPEIVVPRNKNSLCTPIFFGLNEKHKRLLFEY